MKITNNFNQYLHPDLIEIRRLKSVEYNKKHKARQREKLKYNYYKQKLGSKIIDEYITQYGNDEKVIKALLKKELKKMNEIIKE